MKLSSSQRAAAQWATAIVLSLLVIAFGWSFRPSDSSDSTPPDTSNPAAAPTTSAPHPHEEGQEQAENEGEAVTVVDLDFQTTELAERVSAFEAGYRSVYRNETAEQRREKVRDYVADETLGYLTFEQPQPLEAEELSYDIVAEALDPEAVIDGLFHEIAHGEVTLPIAVQYTRVDADGSETRLGTLLKLSQWEYRDETWLLTGTDT